MNTFPIGLPEILILVVIVGGIYVVYRALTKRTN